MPVRLPALTAAALLGACATTPLAAAPAEMTAPAPAPEADPARVDATAAATARTEPAPAPAAAPDQPLVLRLQRPAGGEWLGLYLLGEKAGWLFADTAADTFDGRPAIRAELALTLALSVGGKVARREVVDRRWYEHSDDGRLLGFEAIRRGDGGDRRVLGSCDTSSCEVRIHHQGGVEERQLPLPPERAHQADPVRLAAATNEPVEVTWLDLDELQLHTALHSPAGAAGSRARVLTREAGESLDIVTLLDASGATAEVQLGPGLVARAEPEAEARALGEPAEIFSLTSVPLPGPLPAAPAQLVLEIVGLPEALWRRDGRQRFEPLEGGAVRVHIDSAATRPVDPAERDAFLATSPSVDWRDPGIRAIAAALPPADARTRAELLLFDVHERLDKVYGSSSDRASRVLAEGKGDCTEHALLYVALARAGGIPARQVHGLAHADAGAGPALYWHEWVEVWVDDAWIAVDPTFGQFPADATHLSLGAGRSSASTQALGQVRIRRATATSFR